MGIICEVNSIKEVCEYSPMRCDTHFKHNIKLASEFFNNNNIEWVSLGSILDNVKNGMNLGTDYYSMEETGLLYISVSQIKEYGLIQKNQNYILDTVRELKNYYEIKNNCLLVTRSGTIGVALSSDHPSFDMDEKAYIASGFVITAEMKNNISSKIIANYINLFSVQRYLIAMSAGACQKNISQPVICNLPIPEILLQSDNNINKYFDEYEIESKKIIDNISLQELRLQELKNDISHSISKKLIKFYE